MADSIPCDVSEETPVDHVNLFLCGDVMTGRGIDQILPVPSDAQLHEPYVTDAQCYVKSAEAAHGPIPRSVPPAYLWGDALEEWNRAAPDLKIVNLETAVTTSDAYWPSKEVHYRMHPQNAGCLTAAGIICCVLANNHVLDWGIAGLEETLETLQHAGIVTAGAGRTLPEAQQPAVCELANGGRVLIVAMGSPSSGIPREWAAGDVRPGVYLVDETSHDAVAEVRELLTPVKRPRDLALASIHWGSNWDYNIPREQREFAHALIDAAGIDLVYGHSSHHVKGLEVYRGKMVLYGCGDFLTDYEGIQGFETFRGDLGLMYFVTLDLSAETLVRLQMVPIQMRSFQIKRVSPDDADWLAQTLDRESRKLGIRVERDAAGALTAVWD